MAARKTPQSSPQPTDPTAAPVERSAAPATQRQRRARHASVNLRPRTPLVGSTDRAAPTTKAPPQPPYWLVFDRNRWDVFGDSPETMRVLPALSKAKLQPGANGVQRDRNNRPLPSLMLAQLAENGRQVIPWDVDGPGTSYLTQDAATGGWYSMWERVWPGTADITPGGQPYYDWLQSLIDRGVIEPPGLHVLQRLHSRYQQLSEEVGPGAKRDEQNGAQYERHQHALRAIEAELDVARAEMDGEVYVAPAATTSPAVPEIGTGEPEDLA